MGFRKYQSVEQYDVLPKDAATIKELEDGLDRAIALDDERDRRLENPPSDVD